MRKLSYNSLSHQELIAAAEWYNTCEEGLGDVLLKNIYEAISNIIQMPEAWPPFWKGTRHYPLNRFLIQLCIEPLALMKFELLLLLIIASAPIIGNHVNSLL